MKTYYRYNATFYANGTMSIGYREFEKLRDTPAGFFVVPKGYKMESQKKWIKYGAKKKFAYGTKEQAWESFVRRSKMRLSHAKRRHNEAQQIISRIESLNGDMP